MEAPGRYSLIPKPVNVTLNGNKTFEYVIKDFKTEIIMDYLGGSNVIKRAPKSRRDRQTYNREGEREREECEGKRMRERNVFECCRQFRDKKLSKGHQILNC